MTETFIRNLVALCGSLIVLLAYYSGYVSAGHGWWWTGFGVVFIYVAIHKMLGSGGH